MAIDRKDITPDEIERVKTHMEDYLISKGIDTRKKFRCLSIDHIDNNPSMQFNKKDNYAHCFSCGATFDIFDLISIDKNLSKKDAFIETIKMFEPNLLNKQHVKSIPNKQDQLKTWQEAVFQSKEALDYLHNRGLSDETIKKYGIGFNSSFYAKVDDTTYTFPAIIIPREENSYTARNINWKPTDNKDIRIRKNGASTIYNLNQSNNSDKSYCFIAEGEFDCLSFLELGYNAIGLGSCSNSNKLFNSNLDTSKTYILALDNDEAGQETTEKIANEFKVRNIKFITFNYGGVIKDPNEALTTDKQAFLTGIQGVIDNMQKLLDDKNNESKKEYLKNTALAKLAVLDKFIEETENFTPYSTGFKNLDTLLYGGLYPGFSILGAPSSTGKTTFALQMADNMAKTGKDVMFFSLEMPELELMCKSLARITFEQDTTRRTTAKTMDEIMYGFHYKHYRDIELEAIQNAREEYSKYADNLFIFECPALNVYQSRAITVHQIESAIKNHIEQRGKKPAVFIDYLQIIAPAEKNSDIKQILDFNVSELKRIARKYFIPIFAISAVNRQSYDDKMEMTAFKSSGGIEYGADYLFGLQFTSLTKPAYNEKGKKIKVNIDEEKSKPIREVSFDIIKQRNGETCKLIDFEYKAKFNYFKEKEDSEIRTSTRNLDVF